MTNSLPLDQLITLKPHSTALIVIDIQVDFCSSNGFAAQRGKQLTQIQSIVPKLNIFSNQLSDIGITIIFTKFISGKNITPLNLSKAVAGKGHFIPCMKSSGGEDLYRVKLPSNAIVIEKPHYDSFAYTNLKETLVDRKIKTVLITGLRTEICVDVTAKRAAAEGYDTIIISDLVASYDDKKELHDQVLTFFDIYNGFVADSQTVLKLLRQ